MADKGDGSERTGAKTDATSGKSAAKPEPKVIHLSLPKKTAQRSTRVKRWEERSQSVSLELTGRS